MAKIVFKNILRSFGIGVLAVVVAGIFLLLLFLIMGLIILFLYWIKVEEKVITIITYVTYALTLVAGIFVASCFRGVFADFNAVNDNNGYKKKTYPPIKAIKIAPCVPLIFSLLLLPVFVLCIVAFYWHSFETWIAGLFPNLSVDQLNGILFYGSGLLGAFMGTLFFYYFNMVSSYKILSCHRCRLAFCIRAAYSSTTEDAGVQYKTKTKREQVGTIKYGSAQTNVYADVDQQDRKSVV